MHCSYATANLINTWKFKIQNKKTIHNKNKTIVKKIK